MKNEIKVMTRENEKLILQSIAKIEGTFYTVTGVSENVVFFRSVEKMTCLNCLKKTEYKTTAMVFGSADWREKVKIYTSVN